MENQNYTRRMQEQDGMNLIPKPSKAQKKKLAPLVTKILDNIKLNNQL